MSVQAAALCSPRKATVPGELGGSGPQERGDVKVKCVLGSMSWTRRDEMLFQSIPLAGLRRAEECLELETPVYEWQEQLGRL